MTDERRNHERRKLEASDMEARFEVRINSEVHPFDKVNDVSISGMGLQLPVEVAQGSKVELSFVSTDLTIDLSGEAVWVDSTEDVHRIGVKFDTSNVDNNVLFFMSVREFLDDFDAN